MSRVRAARGAPLRIGILRRNGMRGWLDRPPGGGGSGGDKASGIPGYIQPGLSNRLVVRYFSPRSGKNRDDRPFAHPLGHLSRGAKSPSRR